MIPTGRPSARRRISSTVAPCSACVPWEKLRRKTSAPASMSARSMGSLRLAGPTVATTRVRAMEPS